MTARARLPAIGIALGLLVVGILPVRSARHPAPEPSLDERFARLQWVSFAPTGFDPTTDTYPGEASLREDLRVLCQAGFGGILTYDAGHTLAEVPRLARAQCVRGVVLGIWCVTEREAGCSRGRIEQTFGNAVRAAHHVDAYVVGNEGLGSRYSRADLDAAIERLRAATGRPVTTSEQIEKYLSDPSLLEIGDFILPNAHPFWHDVRTPERAADWTADQFQRLKSLLVARNLGAKTLLFKEVGLPTAGCAECSEVSQAIYYRSLEALRVRRLVLFAYFEAFDQPSWKRWHPVEPHWGLFTSDRRPKLVVSPPR